MESLVTNILGLGMALSTPVLIAMEVLKYPELIPSKWLPWCSCLLGILAGVACAIFYPEMGAPAELIAGGFIAGAVASGIYKIPQKTGGTTDDSNSN